MADIPVIGAVRNRMAAADVASGTASADPASRALPYNVVSRGSRSGELTPAQKFESFVLQSFIEPMLPKEDSSYFGEGTAGSIWKSMLAERIGAEMAESGGIGIAKLVEKRNASIEALDQAREDSRRSDVSIRGAALSKPGSL